MVQILRTVHVNSSVVYPTTQSKKEPTNVSWKETGHKIKIATMVTQKTSPYILLLASKETKYTANYHEKYLVVS